MTDVLFMTTVRSACAWFCVIAEIDELWQATPNGTLVEIVP